MKKRVSILLLMLCYLLGGYSQQLTIATLEKEVANTKVPDAEKVLPLARLTLWYEAANDDKAFGYAEEALRLSGQERDKKYALYAYSALASIYGGKNDVRRCYNLIDTCMQYMKQTSDNDARAFALNRIARNKMLFGDRDEVHDMLSKALELLKEKRNHGLESEIYYSMYCYYSFLYSDLQQAGGYAARVLRAAEKSGNPRLIVQGWNAIGHHSQRKFELMKWNDVYIDSAIYAFNRSLSIYNANSDRIPVKDNILALVNLSSAYAYKNGKGNTYTDSVTYYAKRSLERAGEINDIPLQMRAYMQMSNGEIADGRLAAAEEILQEARQVLDTSGYPQLKYQLYTALSDLSKRKEDYRAAQDYTQAALDNLEKSKDEVLANRELILMTKSRMEKKDRQSEAEQVRNYLCIGILVFLLSTVVFVMLFRRYRAKYHHQKEMKMQRESEILILFDQLRDIRDSHTELEILVANMQEEYKSQLIQDLHNNLPKKEKMEHVLNKDLKIDRNFEDFKRELKHINHEFYNKLQIKAKPKLTALDMKYCICIFMKMSSKEIGDLLGTEPDAVKMTKYRLKQKFGLERHQKLDDFIQRMK